MPAIKSNPNAPAPLRAMQQKLRGKTMRRLQIVKPYTGKSHQDLASDILDAGLQTIAVEKHISMPASCAFDPVPVTK